MFVICHLHSCHAESFDYAQDMLREASGHRMKATLHYVRNPDPSLALRMTKGHAHVVQKLPRLQ